MCIPYIRIIYFLLIIYKMDISNNFHIRVHRSSTFDPSFVIFCHSVSDKFIITREGGGYDKTKHRFVRPHVHIWLHSQLSHLKLREAFKKSFPGCSSGNKDYSIHSQKKDNLLSYILKGNKIIDFHGVTKEYIDNVPVWLDKKVLFKQEVWNHIQYKMDEYKKHNSYKIVYQPYGYRNYLHDIMRFCKDNDRWLPKTIIIRYAYQLDVISVDAYLDYMHLLKLDNFS